VPICLGMERRPTPYDHLSHDQLIDLVVERDVRIRELEAQNRALTARVAELEAENRALRARMTELESQVQRLLEKLGNPPTPGNSSLPRSQGRKANRPDREPKAKPPRRGFHRRELHPDPDAVVDCRPERCRHCGGAALTKVGIESYDHHELVPRPVLVTRVNLGVCACARCGRRTTAEPPAGMEELIGGRLRAFTVLLRHHTDVPYARLRTLLDEVFGLRLSHGYLVATIDTAAAAMAPAAQDIREAVRTAPVVLSDETGLRVDGRNAWAWVFRTPWDILFLVDRRRAKTVVAELMAGHQPEAWVSDRGPAQGGHAAERQACLAHLVRDCRKAEELGDTTFAPALKAVLATILRHDARKPAWADSTLALRLGEVERRLDAVTAIEARHREGEKLRRWVKAHRAELTLCLRRRDVPATNNASERALRPFVTARKVFGCARSKEGADAMAVIRSVLMTARARGLQVMDALAIALAGGILPPGDRPAPA
jgi:transposase